MSKPGAAGLAARGNRQDDRAAASGLVPGAAAASVALNLVGKSADDARRVIAQHLADRPGVDASSDERLGARRDGPRRCPIVLTSEAVRLPGSAM